MFRRLFSAIEVPQADRRLSKLPDPPDESKRAQASAIDRITPQNEQFLRTYHPAFEMAPDIFVRKITLEDNVWAVHPSHIRDCSYYRKRTDVAGRVVHGVGASSTVRMALAGFQSKLKAEGSINTRKTLSEGEIMAIREHFPEAIGLRVFVAGYLTVLFKSVADLKNVAYRAWPSELGNLKVQLEVWNDRSCTDERNAMQLGIRLMGTFDVDGESREMEVITAATNDFVTTPELSSTVANYVSPRTIHGLLSPFRTLAGSVRGVAQWSTKMAAGYAAVGKQVMSPDGSAKLGMIVKSYDEISMLLPFPYGYQHNISLIAGDGLAHANLPSGLPSLLGFASFEDALADGASVVTIQRHPGGETIVRKSLVEGQQYTWDSAVMARSLLWRTMDDAVFDMRGSATMLCLNDSRGGDVVRLVAFQSFQATLPTSGVRERTGTVFFEKLGECEGGEGDDSVIWYRGGFEIPAEVMRADIVRS